MRVEEDPAGQFEIYISSDHYTDAKLELADLVELRAHIDRALMDYLARNVSRLRLANSQSEGR